MSSRRRSQEPSKKREFFTAAMAGGVGGRPHEPDHGVALARSGCIAHARQSLAGVQIGALGRELVAVARALMEHLGVHKLAPSYGLMPHALGRSVGKRAIKIEKMVCFDVAGALRDDAEGTCSRNTREWRRR